MSLSSERLQEIEQAPDIEEIEIPADAEVGFYFEFGERQMNMFTLAFESETPYQELWVVEQHYPTRDGRSEYGSIILQNTIQQLMQRGRVQVVTEPSFNFTKHKPHHIQSIGIGSIYILVDKPQAASNITESAEAATTTSTKQLILELVSRALLAVGLK